MKTNLLPQSQAKNALELMLDVRKEIDAEPRRVNMDRFIIDLDGDSYAARSAKFDLKAQGLEEPPCGAQGCIAGHMMFLKRHFAPEWRAEEVAYALLPDELQQDANDLFFGSDKYPWPQPSDPGTRRYADQVLVNLDKFIEEHRDALEGFRY